MVRGMMTRQAGSDVWTPKVGSPGRATKQGKPVWQDAPINMTEYVPESNGRDPDRVQEGSGDYPKGLNHILA
jgi:hypothetical protein